MRDSPGAYQAMREDPLSRSRHCNEVFGRKPISLARASALREVVCRNVAEAHGSCLL